MDERAVRVEIPGLRWDAGAPEPVVMADERRTLFAFYLPDSDVVGDSQVRTAEFANCVGVNFGFPNDEAMPGHPLWGRGLEFYAVHEVENSSWLGLVRSIARVHPAAPATPYADSKHLILTFHDSTLEAIANGVIVLDSHASMRDAIAFLADLVLSR